MINWRHNTTEPRHCMFSSSSPITWTLAKTVSSQIYYRVSLADHFFRSQKFCFVRLRTGLRRSGGSLAVRRWCSSRPAQPRRRRAAGGGGADRVAGRQELKATADTLRALQVQLERALQAAGLPGGSAGATLTAVLETKEARIATLERQVALLEGELAALGSPPPPSFAPSNASIYDKVEPPFKRQVSFLLNDVRVMKDGRLSAPPPPPRPALRCATRPHYYSATTLWPGHHAQRWPYCSATTLWRGHRAQPRPHVSHHVSIHSL